jgi:hypothetical protein
MMLYLGIDQHARQITISIRAEDGDVLQLLGPVPHWIEPRLDHAPDRDAAN